MTRRSIMWMALMAALALGPAGAAPAGAAPAEPGSAPVSEPPLADWTLRRPDGSTLGLAELHGRPAAILFWSTRCPYCRRLMPGIQRLHERYGEQGLQVVAISFRDPGDTVGYFRELGLDFDQVIDGDAVARSWSVRGTPTLVFLDAAGRERYRTSASDPDDSMLDIIAHDLLGIDAEECDLVIC